MDDIYKQLFDQHYKNLCDYAFTIVNNSDQAEDIVQSAFIKLWERQATVDLSNCSKTYLFTSVYRSSLNVIRNQKARHLHHLEMKNNSNIDNADLMEFKETTERIQKTINQLPCKCKEVFYKSRFEGKRYSEIGNEMGISVKTVEGQMGKALKFLRQQLPDLALFGIVYLFI